MEASDDEKKNAYSRPPPGDQPCPWLVIRHGKSQERQTFYSTSENHYYPRIIPDMCSKLLWTSSFGWLVLEEQHSDDIFLLNISSMEKALLPKLNSSDYFACVLSSAPTDPDCLVMFINRSDQFVKLCRPGDVEYIKQEYQLGGLLIAATTFKGKVYALTSVGFALVVADFTGRSLQFREIIGNDGLCRELSLQVHMCSNRYLIESENELLLVHKIYLGFSGKVVADFIVFRAEFSKMEWVKLESIGQRTIFLHRVGGMASSSVEAGTRPNCIYFVDPGDKNLYVFDLEYRSITILLPCPNVSSRQETLSSWVWF